MVEALTDVAYIFKVSECVLYYILNSTFVFLYNIDYFCTDLSDF